MSPGPTFGPYPTSGVLGSGGMGVVYLARDPKLGRELAIKTLTGGARADDTKRRRFQREARALAELSHPGLVSIVDAGVQDGVPWLAMLRVPGVTLEEQLRQRGRLSSEEVCDLGVQLCSALAVAHGRGILHRDLKPENVLVTKDGRYVITDFGLTKDLAGAISGDLSKTGALIGTPGYWAPEQAMGHSSQASLATDVYGVGAVLYAALTGVPPISAPSLLEAVVATQERPPVPPSSLVQVAPGLEDIVLRCLAKSPEDRYDAVDVLEEALRELGREQARSGKGRGALLVAGAVLAFLSGVGGVLLLSEPPGGSATHESKPPSSNPPNSSPPNSSPPSSSPPSSSPPNSSPPNSSPPSSSPPNSSPPNSSSPDSSPPTPAKDPPRSTPRPTGESPGRGEEDADLEGGWQRYLRLRAELEERGSGDQAWHDRLRKARALATSTAERLAETSQGTWARGVAALTELLKDPFADRDPSRISKTPRWEADLQRALATSFRKERQLALREALVHGALRAAFEGRGEDAIRRARLEISAWEAAGGARWRALLARVRLELLAGHDGQALINGCAALELEALRLERPWLRSAVNFFRGELTHGFGRTDQVHLWRSLAGDLDCPPILRGHAANRLAATLLEIGEPADALSVLSQAPPPPSVNGLRVSADRGVIKAWAQVRARRSAQAQRTLDELPKAVRSLTRTRILRAIALAHEGRSAEARAVAVDITERDLATDRELVLEYAALTAPAEQVRGLLDRFSRNVRSLEALVCADRLERLISTELPSGAPLVAEPAPIRGFVQDLRRQFAPTVEAVVEDHLHAGLWALAARRIEQPLEKGGPEDAELRIRLHYRVLVRALDEVRPTDEVYRTLHRRAAHLAAASLDRARPHHLALMAALATLGPTPERVQVKRLQAGVTARPKWHELHEAAERVFLARRRLPSQPASLAFGALRVIRHWTLNQPRSTWPRLARVRWSSAQISLEVLQGHEASKPRLAPVVLARLERARLEAGVSSPEVASQGLGLAGHSRLVLTRQRAEILLDLAEIRLQDTGQEEQALLTLDLLGSWCGGEFGDPARYHLARARALLGLGRVPEALPAAGRAVALAAEREPEVRAQALAILGWAEVASGQAGGAERLRLALELAPSFVVWLAQARASSGSEAEAGYAEALSRVQLTAQINPLWREILKRGLDAPRIAGLALRHYEGRGSVALRVLTTLALFLQRPDKRSATLFCRATVQVSLSNGEKQALNHEELSSTYRRALAMLEPRHRELIEVYGETLRALDVSERQTRREAAAGLGAALAALGRATQQISKQEASDFWLPALRERCLVALERLLGKEEFAEVERGALAEARALRAVARPSLRLEFWIGRLETTMRDPRAKATLERALAAVSDYSPLRRAVLFEQGLLLRRLGRNEEALEAYRKAIEETEEPRWKILGLILSAQIQRHLGPEGRKEQQTALLRADSLGLYGVPDYVRKLKGLTLTQLHLDLGNLEQARAALRELEKRFASVTSEAIRCEEALLAAILARKEGDPARALQILSGPDLQTENAAGVALERARALIALGKIGEARSFLLEQLEENEALWPAERGPLRALLEELEPERGD